MNQDKGYGHAGIFVILLIVFLLTIGYVMLQNRASVSTSSKLVKMTSDSNNPLTSSPSSQLKTMQVSMEFACSTADWCKYGSDKSGFSFMYPQGWVVEEYVDSKEGYILAISPAKKKPLGEKLNSGINNIELSYYPNINDIYAKGGEAIGEPTYSNLSEFFKDTEHWHGKRETSETTLDGKKLHEVIVSGNGQWFGLMREYPNGSILEIDFPTAWDKTGVGVVENQILSTFKFVE